jgi:serine/threonine protein kinase
MWSFGVLMCEIANKGNKPYFQLNLSEGEIVQRVKSGELTPPVPQILAGDERIALLLKKCFSLNPIYRPSGHQQIHFTQQLFVVVSFG